MARARVNCSIKVCSARGSSKLFRVSGVRALRNRKSDSHGTFSCKQWVVSSAGFWLVAIPRCCQSKQGGPGTSLLELDVVTKLASAKRGVRGASAALHPTRRVRDPGLSDRSESVSQQAHLCGVVFALCSSRASACTLRKYAHLWRRQRR